MLECSKIDFMDKYRKRFLDTVGIVNGTVRDSNF